MPHKPRLSKNDRKLLTSSWESIANGDESKLHVALNESWLRATEQSPTWVWGVVGVSEAVEGGPGNHPKFKQLINQIVVFIGHGVSMLQNGKDSRFAASCQQLGLRHRRYFADGHRPAYWTVFCRAIRHTIDDLIDEYCAENATFSGSFDLTGGPPEKKHTPSALMSKSMSHDSEHDLRFTNGHGSMNSLKKSSPLLNGTGSNDSSTPYDYGSGGNHNSRSNGDAKLSMMGGRTYLYSHGSTAGLPMPRAKSAPRTSVIVTTAAQRFALKKLPRQFRQHEKLKKAWENLLTIVLDNIRLGYVGNCAKPGGSVGGSLMNILSMSGMMSSGNHFGGGGSISTPSSSLDQSSDADQQPSPPDHHHHNNNNNNNSNNNSNNNIKSHHHGTTRSKKSEIDSSDTKSPRSSSVDAQEAGYLLTVNEPRNRWSTSSASSSSNRQKDLLKAPKLGASGRSMTEANYSSIEEDESSGAFL